MTDWKVDYRPGGWARACRDGLTVYLKLGNHGNGRPRLRIYQAALMADKPVTEQMWRSVPLAEIEAHLFLLSSVTGEQVDRTVEAIRQPVMIEGFSLDALKRYFDETEALPVGGVIPERFTLVKPPDGRLTDEFLRSVAGVYLRSIEAKKAPAPEIATAAGVPVRTVHRWVAEARKRGILPPAARGKAG